MSHLIDFSLGRAAFAFVGEPAWHGLGNALTANATIEDWTREAGLDWRGLRSFVRFATGANQGAAEWATDKENVVLFRSDTKARLGIVSADFKVVQPSDIMGLFKDLTETHGYTLETAGAIKDGRQIWALARGQAGARIGGSDSPDVVGDYLLCSTSFDGTRATVTRRTSVRVVCNNTLTMAEAAGGGHRVTHRRRWSAGDAKRAMGIADFEAFAENADKMSQRKVDPAEAVRFMLSVYHGLTVDGAKAIQSAANGGDAKAISAQRSIAKTLERMATIMDTAPGQNVASARGTAWGLVNAVTYDVDHSERARSADTRLASAWFGNGETLKNAAYGAALQLIAAPDSVDGSDTLAGLLGRPRGLTEHDEADALAVAA